MLGLALPSVAVQPLTKVQRDVFWGSKPDPRPKKLLNMSVGTQGKHFLAGNERHFEVFYPHLKGLGGGYMGVGSDQAYVFIGWMRPQFAWLTDYDLWVVSLHKVYHTLFLSAETPQEFVAYWAKSAKAKTAKMLRAKGHSDHEVRVYELARYKAWIRFRWMKRHFPKLKIPTFVTDLETYTFIRNMIRMGRIRPMLANLLSKRGIKGMLRRSP